MPRDTYFFVITVPTRQRRCVRRTLAAARRQQCEGSGGAIVEAFSGGGASALRCGEQRADLGVEDAAREDAVVEVGAEVEGIAVVHHEVVAA